MHVWVYLNLDFTCEKLLLVFPLSPVPSLVAHPLLLVPFFLWQTPPTAFMQSFIRNTERSSVHPWFGVLLIGGDPCTVCLPYIYFQDKETRSRKLQVVRRWGVYIEQQKAGQRERTCHVGMFPHVKGTFIQWRWGQWEKRLVTNLCHG